MARTTFEHCGKSILPNDKFCSGCGATLAVAAPKPEAPQEVPCAFHPDALTLLTCGKCSKPICVDCLRHTSAGMRCPECAGEMIPQGAAQPGFDGQSGYYRDSGSEPVERTPYQPIKPGNGWRTFTIVISVVWVLALIARLVQYYTESDDKTKPDGVKPPPGITRDGRSMD